MKKGVKYGSYTVGVSQITNKSIVGVTLSKNSKKFGVLRDMMIGGEVCFRPLGIELDNLDFGIHFPTKRDLCKDFMKTGGEVFLFNTEEELFKWMITNN